MKADDTNPRVEAGLPFVAALARRMAATMPHSIDLSDLVQDGVIGLIDAAHRFDDSRGIKFETFAERRIRGAMIDALRKDAWPRGVRRVRRELEAAREKLRATLGHEPSLADLAEAVGSDEARLGKTIVRLNTIESTSPFSTVESVDEAHLPAVMVPAEPERPDVQFERNEVRDRVRRRSRTLPPREQRVISMYYYSEITMKDIGTALGVNESRVSQLHARALKRLREALGSRRRADDGDGRDSRCDSRVPAEAPRRPSRRPSPESDTRVAAAAERRAVVVPYSNVSRAARSKSPSLNGFESHRQAGLFEKATGFGAGDIAGHEDDASRQRGSRRGHRAVELHAVDARHLEIANDEVVTRLGEASQTFRAVAGSIDLKAGVGQRFRHRGRQRRLVFDDQHSQSLERIERDRLLRRRRPCSEIFAAHRNLDEERRARALLRLHPDAAAVLLYDGVRHGEPEAGSLSDLFRREERIEDPILHLFGKPGPIVVDLDDDRFTIAIVPGAHGQRAAAVGALHRLLGVDDQIQQDLLDLMAVGEDLGQAAGQ